MAMEKTRQIEPRDLHELKERNIKIRPIILEAFPDPKDVSRVHGKIYRKAAKFTEDERNKIIAVLEKYGHTF